MISRYAMWFRKRLIFFVFTGLQFCSYNLEQQIDRETDTTLPNLISNPLNGSTVRSLSTIELIFSEAVAGAELKSNFDISGAGKNTLAIDRIEKLSDSKFRISLTGTPGDGEITFNLSGIQDKVGNLLENSSLNYKGDGLPKWRYLARNMSRGLLPSDGLNIVELNGNLYIAYTDLECENENGGKRDFTVVKFNITDQTFSTTGSPCISGTTFNNTSSVTLYADTTTIYTAYRDGNTPDYKASVKKFENNQWVAVGNLNFSPGSILTPSLIKSNNDIYISFRDGSNSNRLAVYTKNVGNSNAWAQLGSAISQGNTFHSSPMAVFNNQLYISFRDGGASSHPYVSRYDSGSTSWNPIALDNSTTRTTSIFIAGEVLYTVYPYSSGNWLLRVKYLDTDLLWKSYAADTDVSSSTPNWLNCGSYQSRPYCNYQSGSGFSFLRVTENNVWQDLSSPGAADSALNGANTNSVQHNNKIYVAVRDTDVAPYTDRLTLLSYE